MMRLGDRTLAARLRDGLAVPVIAAPMFLVSGPELMIACRRAGVIGSFPTVNARTPAILDAWLAQIVAAGGVQFAANLIVHQSNGRFAEDFDVVCRHRVPVAIASVGNPARVVDGVHAYGGIVLADVASLKHARRAAESGVDGLILLCAGAGGNTGWLNPFAFVAAVREFFDGPVVLAGGITEGRQIRAAEVLGADLAYIGTRFIAAPETMAADAYREMLVAANADDVVLTDAVTGIPANLLRPSLERVGFDIEKERGKAAGGFNLLKEESTMRAWRDIWSAGHGVGATKKIESVAEIVAALKAGYG